MSDLLVIGYEDSRTARQAYEQVQQLHQDFVVQLRGLAKDLAEELAGQS